VLEYEGRRTRKQYAIPVVYAESGSRIVALAAHPERKQWWRAFCEPAPATLVVRGESRALEGRLLGGEDRRPALRSYFERNPGAASSLGAPGTPTDVELDGVPAAVVAFEPRG
jgi:hypothetical protein